MAVTAVGSKARKKAKEPLTPAQLAARRRVFVSAAFGLFIFLVLFASTVATIQAGPFGLDLAVDSNAATTDANSDAYAILGGLTVLWIAAGFVAGLFFKTHYWERAEDRGDG